MNRQLDDIKSDEYLLRQLTEAGWSIWFVAKRDDRVVSGPDVKHVAKRCFAPVFGRGAGRTPDAPA
jgi:hypothetical protein